MTARRIAIVGTGIAGNVAAYQLHRDHDITVFEEDTHVGGHTHTHDVQVDGVDYAVDTGFIVFNDRTYPNFTDLLQQLGVRSLPSSMSFSVRCERTGLEYNGTSLNTLFAQRRNLLRPSFLRMLREILRFNREALALLDSEDDDLTLGAFLAKRRYSREFVEHYIVPMGAAVWSADPDQMQTFPARFFVRFFHNHGMLTVDDRPQWRVIDGGSRTYVDRLTAPFRDRIRLGTPAVSIRRFPTYVEVRSRDGQCERFDDVFVACHSDQALRLLADASLLEREVLGAIPYQENEVILHTDTTLLPSRRRAWAAWNYHLLREARGRVAVTYNMNILQNLRAPVTFCVTLNNSQAIAPQHVIKKLRYHHPVFTPGGTRAQSRHSQLNGVNRTYFCGAYWRFGFHEDGVVSALAAVEHFRERTRYQELYLRRAG